LKEGNNRAKYDTYSQQVKTILFNFVLENTNDEICALSSQFSVIDVDLTAILRGLSRKLSYDKKGIINRDEIVNITSVRLNRIGMLIT
jgi:hypothetical protein